MTGEITCGARAADRGLKEKLLARAARRHQDRDDPEENAKDLTEISDSIKGGLDIIRCRAWTRCSSTRWFACPIPSNGTRPQKPVETSVEAVVDEDGSG